MSWPIMQSPTSEKLKVFVVDDHPIFRQGLAQLINKEADLVLAGEAGDAREALAAIGKIRPHLAIIDISLKGTNGIELTKSLAADYPEIPVLIVSMYEESLYVERILRAGAKGYLMKQEATDKLIHAIRQILSGEIYVSDGMKKNLLTKFVGARKGAGGASVADLTDRELEVLQLLGQGKGTRQIAESLFLSVKTVESHYANIKNKLGLKNSNELIQYAVQCFSPKT